MESLQQLKILKLTRLRTPKEEQYCIRPLHAHLTKLLKMIGEKLISLDLTGFDVRFSVLSKLCPQLQNLRLARDWSFDWLIQYGHTHLFHSYQDLSTFSEESFLYLHKLEVHDDYADLCLVTHWCPNLEKLTVIKRTITFKDDQLICFGCKAVRGLMFLTHLNIEVQFAKPKAFLYCVTSKALTELLQNTPMLTSLTLGGILPDLYTRISYGRVIAGPFQELTSFHFTSAKEDEPIPLAHWLYFLRKATNLETLSLIGPGMSASQLLDVCSENRLHQLQQVEFICCNRLTPNAFRRLALLNKSFESFTRRKLQLAIISCFLLNKQAAANALFACAKELKLHILAVPHLVTEKPRNWAR